MLVILVAKHRNEDLNDLVESAGRQSIVQFVSHAQFASYS